MDLESLKQHVDKRFDALHEDVKTYGQTLVEHKVKLEYLHGFSRHVITILIAVAGFFALAFFT